MKTIHSLMLGSLLALGMQLARGQEQITLSIAEQITQSKIFGDSLKWVGEQPPSPVESEALWEIIQNIHTVGGTESLARFEGFVTGNPASGWTPSLRAKLALNYRRACRYSLALQHWEVAWESVKTVTSGDGKQVGDFILVNWLQLLSSLGRVEKLEEILNSVGDRNLENQGWQVVFNGVRSSLDKMRTNPGISFRCGTLALYATAKALGKTNHSIISLVDLPSPSTGFAMSSLLDLADQHHLDLVAVRRPTGAAVIVPSVVHWREGHYAAITDKQKELYLVIDPTFGGSQWLTAEVIDTETSGHFLVPSTLAPNDWLRLDDSTLQTIYGKGLNYAPPRSESPPCPEEGQDPCDCTGSPPSPSGTPGAPSPSPGRGSGPGNCCGPPLRDSAPPKSVGPGMPAWQVTEPFLALWLHDKPMLYQTAKGTEVSLRLSYHSDAQRPDDTNVFNFGPLWNSNWSSYIDVGDVSEYSPGDPIDPLFANYSVTNYGAAGGQRTFIWDDALYGHVPYYGDHTTFEKLDDGTKMTGGKIHYPNGSVWTYGLVVFVSEYQPLRRLFLTEQSDAQGRNTRYYYSTNTGKVYLTHMVDVDGRTNTLSYNTNSAVPTQVLYITNAYGDVVSFKYNANRFMTNVVDVAGLNSSFAYLQTNGLYVLTSLTTPYGSTSFEYHLPRGNLYGTVSGGDDINRAIRVTEPNGAKHLYMYRDNTPSTPARTDGPTVPCYYPDVPTNGYQTWTGSICTIGTGGESGGFCNYNMIYRNSFYWGPRHAGNLSTANLLLLTQADYNKARLRNWLHGVGNVVSETINIDRDQSPDGTTPGQITWYAYYKGDAGYHYQGTNINPNFVARILPNGETHYVYREFNHVGKVTLEKTSITQGGAIGYRTNQFDYALGNVNDLIRHYDGFGNLVASNAYNSLHQIATNWNTAGDKTTYSYNANGQLTGSTLPTGLVITNVYDSNGFLTNSTEMAGGTTFRSTAFTYTNGQVYTRLNELGAWTTNTWDSLRRITSQSDSDGTISYAYSNLDLVQITDRLNNVTRFGYDSMRRKTAEVDARGNRTSYAYCNCGSLDYVTNALSETTQFVYDSQGKRTQVIHPDGYTVTYAYNLPGQLVNVTDSGGLNLTNWYNNQGLLVTSSNAFGQIHSVAVDVEDRTTNTVDANGVSIGLTLDALGRVVARTYPDAGVERLAYTARGLIAYTNQLSKVTRYFYDEARRKTLETNANSEITQFKYDTSGNLTNLIDGKSQNTYWRYDLHSHVTNKLDHNALVLFRYKYDAGGRLTNRWSVAKGDTYYSYDAMGNLTLVNYPVSPDITLSYDALNRVTNMLDSVGTTAYSYDSVGQLLSEDGPWENDTVTYTYANRLRSGLILSQPNASTWSQSYSYDAVRRLASVTSPAGAFSYTYHAGLGGITASSSLVKGLAFPSGANLTNAFDSVGRITEIRLRNSGGTLLNEHDYVYNSGNQRTKQTRKDGDYVDYSYDDNGQLKSALGYESGGTTNRWQERFFYGYDKACNLSNRVQNVQTNVFNVDSLNQLTSVVRTNASATVGGCTLSAATNVTIADNGNAAVAATRYADRTFARTNVTLVNGTNTFTAVAKDNSGRGDTNAVTAYLPVAVTFLYDQNGNLRTNGSVVMAYDDENQLIALTNAGAWMTTFTYDGKMRLRISRDYEWRNGAWVLTNETHRVYDGMLVIQERDQFNVAKITYTRGKDLSGSLEGAGGIGSLLALSDHKSPILDHSYFHSDGNGNVTCLVDTHQNVVVRYLYDPFGNTLAATGPKAGLNKYRFSSKEWHAPSGIVYYGYRWYVPELQRWPNRDPLGERGFESTRLGRVVTQGASRNEHLFVHNNTIGRIDPLGLQWWGGGLGLLFEEPPVIPPAELIIPKPPTPPPGTVPNPFRPGSWGRVDPQTGRFQECWRHEPGIPGRPGWGGIDHWHYWGTPDHLVEPLPPFEWFTMPPVNAVPPNVPAPPGVPTPPGLVPSPPSGTIPPPNQFS